MAPDTPERSDGDGDGRPGRQHVGAPGRRLGAMTLRWGIVATGVIARAFARDLAATPTGRAVAVASRDAGTAARFAERFGLERSYGSYEALLGDPDVDAVYIATPHPMHAMWAVRAAEAGKHVLCEKPLTLNHADAAAVVEGAHEHGVFLMEAFMYRCHPQTAALVSLLQAGVVGEVRVVEAVHSFRGPGEPYGRLLASDLGGGGILDVGCYCMSGARLVAGVAAGAGVAEPDVVTGAAHVGPTGVDEWAVASLRFAGGIVAHLSCGVAVDQAPLLRVHGSEGTITLHEPWLPTAGGTRSTTITVGRTGGEAETIEVDADLPLYAYQAEVVADAVARGVPEAMFPAPSWADTLGNMRALDAWRQAVGVTYPAESPAGLVMPVHGRALHRRSSLPAGAVAGLRTPVTRLVMGTMLAEGPSTLANAMNAFDAYFERGGNSFDSAYTYGRGESDKALGLWMERRGVRDDVVVIAKGAHTPHCDPEGVTRQLAISLERLRTDHVDLYFLHRDNPDVPVGEFVDVLDEHRRAGRIAAFGGSNWTAARIDEANRYAAEHGLVGFTAVSNQFSLARMVVPTYEGTVGTNEPAFVAWMKRTGMPLFAWSSQASGFFAGLPPDGFLAHAWYDEAGENAARRRRVEQLAGELGCAATALALAWVLHQPLPIFPIIGPRLLSELRTSMAALDLTLTPDQEAWLDLRT